MPGARARGDRRNAQAEIGQTYGLPQDALDKLPTMELQLALKIIPVIAKAVLGNSFNIRQLMSTSYHTLLMDDGAELVKASFTAGKAYALEAQKLRDLHHADPTQHKTPEAIMGPDCVQVFLEAARALKNAGEKVGMRNKEAWETIYTRLDPMPTSELTFLVRGFRVSQCYKEGMAKIVMCISDPNVEQCFLRCAEQLGAEHKPGVGPRGHQERLLQMALDQFSDV